MGRNLLLFGDVAAARGFPHSQSGTIPICKVNMVRLRLYKNFYAILRLLALTVLCLVAGHAQDNVRKVLKKAPVTYPTILKSRGIGGVVRLKVFVKPDGTVRNTEVLGGNPILAESAQKSVMQWKFSPGSSETALEISVVFDPHAESGS